MNKTSRIASVLRHFFVLILLVFSLGQLQRFQLTPTTALYAHDVLIVSWLIGFAAAHRHKLLEYTTTIFSWLKDRPLIWILVGWIGFGMVMHLIATNFNDIIPLLYLLRTITYITFALASRAVFQNGVVLRSLWTTAGLLILIFGLLQYILLPDMRFLFLFGWDDHYFRLISTIFDPAFTGMILVLCFAYFYSLQLYQTNEKHYLKFLNHTYTKVICLIMISIGILLTYSRSSLLALGVFLTALGMQFQLRKQKRKPWWQSKIILTTILLPPILLAVYLAVPKPGGLGVNLLRTTTITARIKNTTTNLQAIDLQTLLMGKGLFTRTQVTVSEFGISHAVFPDNLLVMLLVALGLPGMLLSLYGLYIVGKTLYRKDPILLSAYLGLLLHAQFNNTLLQPFVLLYFLGGLSSMRSVNNGN